MNGRTYAIPFNAVAVTAAQDLFEVVAGSTKGLELVSIDVGQYSDAGDAADELLGVQILRGNTTSGSGGSAPTPTPMTSTDTAFSGTAEVNNTTVASAGTAVSLFSGAFNVRAGWQYLPPMDARPVVLAGERLVVRIPAPADSLTMNGTMVVRELS